MILTPEDKLILSVVKLNPSLIEIEQINGLISQIHDWDYLISTIINRGIGPLLYKKLFLLSNSSLIPTIVKDKLQQAYYKTFSRGTILYEHFRKVVEAFRVKNIPVIALKGIYLSEWLYQDIGLRQFSDIDLLVREEDGKECLKILERLGYKPSDDKRSEFVKVQSDFIHYSPLVLDGVSIEIHVKLHRETEKYFLPIDLLWKKSIPVRICNENVYALNIDDLLIHLCLHLDKHFREGHVQFTCFNDITNALEKYVDILDWNVFTDTCRTYNCEDVVFEYIVLVNKYMNARVPDNIIRKYAVLLTKKDEYLFTKYLRGYNVIGNANAIPSHFKSLKSLNSFSDRFRFIWDVLFPTKAFMIIKYQINRPGLVLFYYPYRWWIGVKGMMKVISGK